MMMKVLFIVEQCNPEWPSVPLVAYNLWNELAKIANVHLVTHERNRSALEQRPWCSSYELNNNCNVHRKIDYIEESSLIKHYYKVISFVLGEDGTNWPLYHALSYPIYSSFNHQVYKKFAHRVNSGEFDIVHAFTPVLPRYPVSISRIMTRPVEQNGKISINEPRVPFVLGPVNGGLPFPIAFQKMAQKEGGHFNFLRKFIHYIPNYNTTYLNASLILAGSRYTQSLIVEKFPNTKDRIELFHENGVTKEFFQTGYKGYPLLYNYNKYKSVLNSLSKYNIYIRKKPLQLLFAGRLVAYKGAHLVLLALSIFYAQKQLRQNSKKLFNLHLSISTNAKRQFMQNSDYATLTIVGEGPEYSMLKKQVVKLGIENCVKFTGQKKPHEMKSFYNESDVFVFPSIREFGGAVVLEAMASGLTCIVVNHGGIGEYIDESCGIKIDPLSSEYIIQKIVDALVYLDSERSVMKKYSYNAVEKAKKYIWSEKARSIIKYYAEIINSKR